MQVIAGYDNDADPRQPSCNFAVPQYTVEVWRLSHFSLSFFIFNGELQLTKMDAGQKLKVVKDISRILCLLDAKITRKLTDRCFAGGIRCSRCRYAKLRSHGGRINSQFEEIFYDRRCQFALASPWSVQLDG